MKTLMAYRNGHLLYSRSLVENNGVVSGVRENLLFDKGLYIPMSRMGYDAIEDFESENWGNTGYTDQESILFFLLNSHGIMGVRGGELGEKVVSHVWYQCTGKGEWLYTPHEELETALRTALHLEKDLMEALALVSKVIPINLDAYSVIPCRELVKNHAVWSQLGNYKKPPRLPGTP